LFVTEFNVNDCCLNHISELFVRGVSGK